MHCTAGPLQRYRWGRPPTAMCTFTAMCGWWERRTPQSFRRACYGQAMWFVYMGSLHRGDPQLGFHSVPFVFPSRLSVASEMAACWSVGVQLHKDSDNYRGRSRRGPYTESLLSITFDQRLEFHPNNRKVTAQSSSLRWDLTITNHDSFLKEITLLHEACLNVRLLTVLMADFKRRRGLLACFNSLQ